MAARGSEPGLSPDRGLGAVPLRRGATWQPANFGRVYAAYGGVFIVLSILLGWEVDKIPSDRFDFVGEAVALVGVLTIIYWPRD